MPDSIAIQLNDTHPTVAIPELMRLLIDEHGSPWAESWRITSGCSPIPITRLLPEALETWPVAMFERLLPRHLADHLRDQPRFSRRGRRALPRRSRPARRLSIITDEGTRDAGAHGALWRSSAVIGSTASRSCIRS
jgi:glycogen phosphorylase